MKVLLFGSTGQLGAAVLRTAPEDLALVSAPRSMELQRSCALEEYVLAQRQDFVISAAAMTDVDGAHLRPEQWIHPRLHIEAESK